MADGVNPLAENAWRVIHECRRQPAQRSDGTVDPDAFIEFIDTARELCGKADKLSVCDFTLGQILAHAPDGSDGVWPFEPARDVLDRPDLNDLRKNFQIGVINKRGGTTRFVYEGGKQERELAELYRGHAKALENSHMYVSEAFEELARWFEKDGISEDLEAGLRSESY